MSFEKLESIIKKANQNMGSVSVLNECLIEAKAIIGDGSDHLGVLPLLEKSIVHISELSKVKEINNYLTDEKENKIKMLAIQDLQLDFVRKVNDDELKSFQDINDFFTLKIEELKTNKH